MADGEAVYGLPYWDRRDWADAWDTLVLGADIWPGIAEISGAGVSRKLDIKQSIGTDGATMKDEGYQPARLTISITIYSEAQWLRLQELLPKVHPRKPGGSRTPLEIYHPQSSLLGITQIYIDKIGIPKKPSAGDGLCVLEMSAVEWVPAPKPVRTGAGTGAASTQAVENTAADDLESLSQELGYALANGDADAVANITNLIEQATYNDEE